MKLAGKPFRTVVSITKADPKEFDYVLSCGHILRKRHSKCAPRLKCPECPAQWTTIYERCIRCKRTDRKHSSAGRCWYCDRCIRKPPGSYADYSQNRIHAVDDMVFDTADERGAYLLGVLYAEGSLSSNGRYGVKIGLSAKDLDWLLILKEAFRFTGKIVRYTIRDKWAERDAVSFQFSSKRIYANLVAHGIREQRLPILPDYAMPHFVRGFFDGDGSIFFDSRTATWKASFVGNRDLLSNLRGEISRLAGTSDKMQVHPKPNTTKAFSLAYGPRDTKRLGNWMYENASLFLHRKKDRFERIEQSVACS